MRFTCSPCDHGDEIITWFFQPDTLVPYEYFETARHKLPLEAEKHTHQKRVLPWDVSSIHFDQTL